MRTKEAVAALILHLCNLFLRHTTSLPLCQEHEGKVSSASPCKKQAYRTDSSVFFVNMDTN